MSCRCIWLPAGIVAFGTSRGTSAFTISGIRRRESPFGSFSTKNFFALFFYLISEEFFSLFLLLLFGAIICLGLNGFGCAYLNWVLVSLLTCSGTTVVLQLIQALEKLIVVGDLQLWGDVEFQTKMDSGIGLVNKIQRACTALWWLWRWRCSRQFLRGFAICRCCGRSGVKIHKLSCFSILTSCWPTCLGWWWLSSWWFKLMTWILIITRGILGFSTICM